MSAYGAMAAPKPVEALEPMVYPLKAGSISLHPVSAAEAPKDLVASLHKVFSRELEGESYECEWSRFAIVCGLMLRVVVVDAFPSQAGLS